MTPVFEKFPAAQLNQALEVLNMQVIKDQQQEAAYRAAGASRAQICASSQSVTLECIDRMHEMRALAIYCDVYIWELMLYTVYIFHHMCIALCMLIV